MRTLAKKPQTYHLDSDDNDDNSTASDHDLEIGQCVQSGDDVYHSSPNDTLTSGNFQNSSYEDLSRDASLERDDVTAGWDAIDQHVTLSSDSEDEKQCGSNLGENLAAWAAQFQIKQNAIDSLLRILKQAGLPNLPITARTLLKTARTVPTEIKSGVEYFYFGLKTGLLEQLTKYPANVIKSVNSLELSFNIDGLPLFKSSAQSLWPVLCSIVNLKPVRVFPVALTLGKGKPTDLDFLSETLTDLNDLLHSELQNGDDSIAVSVRCIVCDAPAKAFVKQVKQYSGYFGCDKCTQRGQWIGRLTYPEVIDLEDRTDASFRSRTYEDHHTGLSPFCRLPIDMVKAFPIDYMHQVCLGTMRRLLLAWLRGNRNVRQSMNQVEQIHPIRIASMINNVEVGVTSADPYLVKSSNPHFRGTTSVRIVVEAAVECAVYLTRWHRDRAFPIEFERQFDGISPSCH